MWDLLSILAQQQSVRNVDCKLRNAKAVQNNEPQQLPHYSYENRSSGPQTLQNPLVLDKLSAVKDPAKDNTRQTRTRPQPQRNSKPHTAIPKGPTP